MLNLSTSPRATRDLGANQIAWLKQHVPSFGKAKEQADDALAHAAKVASEMPEPKAS